jgi:circadian clock protein KaiA
LPSQLSIYYAFLRSDSLAQSLQQLLSSNRYILSLPSRKESLLHFFSQHPKQPLDCLIVQDDPALLTMVGQLYEQGMPLPVVILKADASNFFAHPACVEIELANFGQVTDAIEQAISQFVNLHIPTTTNSITQNLLQVKQQELAEEFPDNSWYIVGVHKRNKIFFE